MERVYAASDPVKVCIVGVGYVGIPLALRFVEVGVPVIGVDIDAEKVESLQKGVSILNHIPSSRISEAVKTGLFKATLDFSEVAKCNFIIFCVPTPLGDHKEPDLSHIDSAIKNCLPHIQKNSTISLESTTYPGTTEEFLKPLLEKRGLKVGQDCFLVFSPEREDPGRTHYNTQTTPKVIGGCTKNCLERGMALYGKIIDRLVPVSSTQAAEMTKLLENIYRAVNIGLVNELKIVADAMNINIWEVLAAAATKPFGYQKFNPGPGLGGHCIPIDPFYLTWKAKEYGLRTSFIELAGETNQKMPGWVVDKVIQNLNTRKLSVNGAKILVLGVTYKENINDCRESPIVDIMVGLRKMGAKISYSDPHIPKLTTLKKTYFGMESTPITEATLGDADLVIVATAHDLFDFGFIFQHSKNIIDTRGVYQDKKEKVSFA